MAITDIESLADAMERLNAAGYLAEFRAVEGGLLTDRCGRVHEPEAFIIDYFQRFEGTTDPDSESILFAIRCLEHGTKGTYAPAYGPNADSFDQDATLRLEDSKRGSLAADHPSHLSDGLIS